MIRDDQLLLHLYHRLFDPDKLQHPSGYTYSDAIIVLIYFNGVIHEPSGKWAWKKANRPLWMRRLKAPSYSQFQRRSKTKSVRLLIAQLNLEFRNPLPHSTEKFCDGKPLVVGGFSKDPDALPRAPA